MNQPRFRPRVVRPRVARDPIMDGEGDPSTFITPAPAMSGGYEIAPGYSESPIMSPVYVPPPLPPVVPAAPAPTVAATPRVVRVVPTREGHGGRNMSPDEIAQAEAAYRSTPEYTAQQAATQATRRPMSDYSVDELRAMRMSDAELISMGRIPPPRGATADELRSMGLREDVVARYAPDVRTPDAPGYNPTTRAMDALAGMTPEQRVSLGLRPGTDYSGESRTAHASVLRPQRGRFDVPAMPEGYMVTSDGRLSRIAAPVPMSSVPTEMGATQSDLTPQDYAAMRSQGPAMSLGPNASSDPSLNRSMPQVQGDAPADNATMPVPVYDGGEITIEAGSYPADENGFPRGPGATVEMGAPQNIRSLAPRVGVPRRRTAPYVAGLPNAPGGTAEMPSAQAPNGIDSLMNGSGMRTPQRSPLDTQRDTLALNVRYAQQRAQDAQAAGEGIADVEIARQRRLEQNEMDRQRAEGIARQNVQRAADRAAAIRIDPSRTMQGASGIANVIAVVLGGIGSGITGGPNQPLAMVQQNIERDLAAQRTDLDTARNAVADQQSILGNVRQEFQSREAADNAFRENALRQAAAQVEIQAQRTNGAEAGDRAANLHEQLLNQADALHQQQIIDETERYLAFDRSRAETGYFDARARATLATASGTEAANARRALMASRGRAPYGSWEEWQRLTPAQQATRMQNAQDAQLTGTPLADAMALSGVPSGGLHGERAPVENGARAGAGGAPEQLDAMELGRRLTNANTMMQSGVDAATANARASLPPGTLERQAVAPEQTLRLAAADNALRTLEGAIARAQVDGNGIAGVGLIDNNLPGMVSSDEALQNRIAIAGAIDSFIRVSSGANAPESEVQRQRDMVIGDGTERALIAGVQYLRGQLDAQLGNTASIGTDVEAQDSLAAQLGVAPRTGPSPGPTPAAPVARPRIAVPRIVAPQGGGMGNFE